MPIDGLPVGLHTFRPTWPMHEYAWPMHEYVHVANCLFKWSGPVQILLFRGVIHSILITDADSSVGNTWPETFRLGKERTRAAPHG